MKPRWPRKSDSIAKVSARSVQSAKRLQLFPPRNSRFIQICPLAMEKYAKLYAEAVAHMSARRFAEAAAACRNILRAAPKNLDAQNLLGLTFLRSGKHLEAFNSFKAALQINPKLAILHLNCGLALSQLERTEDAKQSFARAIACDPRSAEAHFHMGLLLQNTYQIEAAVQSFRSALEINPSHALGHACIGEALLLCGDVKGAAESLNRAIALNPAIPGAYDNLGMTALDEGRADIALSWFERSLKLQPNFAGSHLNRAVVKLRLGELQDGLEEYEWRWRTPRFGLMGKPRVFPQPRWKGEPLNGHQILVWGEQGIGDEIRSAAMVADLLERGENVIVECDVRLTTLFARSFPKAMIVARSEPPSPLATTQAIAFQIPSESVLSHTRPNLDHFPKRAQFLIPDQSLAESLRAKLPKLGKNRPIIGLSWGSYNPQLQRGKSTPLADWEPVLSQTENLFVNLQYGDTTEERAGVEKKLAVHITHLPDLDLTQDIDGLAALISACDLVITVSNTTAHLAGALGVPTWVALPFGHFQPWYWFTERTDSPWYPSVKLYRQKAIGDWPNVLKTIANDLKTWHPRS